MKQKKVLRIAATLYFLLSILSIIRFFPYQKPKAYIDKNTKMMSPFPNDCKKLYFNAFSEPLLRDF